MKTKKDEIISNLSLQSGIDDKIITFVIDNMYTSLKEAIGRKEAINIINFGKFAVSSKKVKYIEQNVEKLENES